MTAARTFSTEADAANEQRAAALVAAHLRASPYHYGRYAPIDWYFERGGIVVAVAEVKTRKFQWGAFDDIYLAHTKWLHLMFAYHYNDVAALFVVQAIDRLMMVDVIDIPSAPVRILGRTPRPGSTHDQEPILRVPIVVFREIN